MVPDVEEVKAWAKIQVIPGTLSVLCNDLRIRDLIIEDITALGKMAGLKSFEQVKNTIKIAFSKHILFFFIFSF